MGKEPCTTDGGSSGVQAKQNENRSSSGREKSLPLELVELNIFGFDLLGFEIRETRFLELD
jgi:hypothetical protein